MKSEGMIEFHQEAAGCLKWRRVESAGRGTVPFDCSGGRLETSAQRDAILGGGETKGAVARTVFTGLINGGDGPFLEQGDAQ